MTRRLDYRILGPLEVLRDGVPLALRGPRLQSLVAALLLRAGDRVSSDVLIDLMWGESVPATAKTALQVQVSKLRKLLGADEVLETVANGYRFNVDPEDLDLRRFDARVTEGRAALVAGRAVHARERLTSALDLWRGEPLEGVELPGLEPAVLTDLLDRRRIALLAKLEADLACGEHEGALGELEALLAVDPLDERVIELLTVARYRAGRHADALDGIARLRRTLSEQLGVDPGPSITSLEASILRKDPMLNAPAPSERAKPHESRTTVSAVTSLIEGENGDPEARRATTEGLRRRIGSLVEEHGGSILSSEIGRLVAVFGLRSRNEDDAARALHVAEAILGSDSDHAPRLRVGVATGEVLITSSGEQRSLLTTDPLEHAERLAREAAVGHVETDRETRRLQSLSPEARLRRAGAQLVGREPELGALREAFSRVSGTRMPAIVTVLGAAGLGKSRLVASFLDGLDDLEVSVAAGRCLPYGADITYWPVAEVVRRLAGIHEGDPPVTARERVRRAAGDDDGEFIAAQLAGLLGLSDVSPSPDDLFWAVRRFFDHAASERPLVVVLEDLHWAEPTLLDLLEHVAKWSRDNRLLLVCTARAELLDQRPTWSGGSLHAVTLPLAPLSDDEGAEVVRHLLGDEPLGPDVLAVLLTTAEGNPLFLEELVGMLVEEGSIVPKEDGWIAVADVAALPIPSTVQAVLGARVDRLPSPERDVLERASIIGEEFTRDDLEALGDGSNDEPWLGALTDREFLVRLSDRPGEVSGYRFRHILVRDAVYRGTPKEVRARHHDAFGDSLEARAGERLAEVEEILGYHLEAAHGYRQELDPGDAILPALAERAAGHLLSAARRAWSRGDAAATEGLTRRALALVDELHEMVPETARLLGSALLEAGRPLEAHEALERGLAAAEGPDHALERWRLEVERWEVLGYVDPSSYGPREEEAFARRAIDAFDALGDRSGAARAWRLLGDSLSQLGRHAEATECWIQGRVIAQEIGDERERWERPNLGMSSGPLPVEQCLSIAYEYLEGTHRPNPDALAGTCLMEAMAGHPERAREMLDRAVARSREIGSSFREVSATMYGTSALLISGDAAAAEAMISPSLETLGAMGERFLYATAAALLAESLYRQGRLDEAMEASLASEAATAPEDVAAQIAWRSVRAKILAARGELEEALRLAREARAAVSDTEAPQVRADAAFDLSVVLLAAGRRDEAMASAEEARRVYDAKGIVPGVARAEDFIRSLDEATSEPQWP